MSTIIHSKIVKIGNSRGIRIPRALLEQAGLSGEVELTVEGSNLIVHSASSTRQGWSSQFKKMAERGDDQLIDNFPETRWDETDWEW